MCTASILATAFLSFSIMCKIYCIPFVSNWRNDLYTLEYFEFRLNILWYSWGAKNINSIFTNFSAPMKINNIKFDWIHRWYARNDPFWNAILSLTRSNLSYWLRLMDSNKTGKLIRQRLNDNQVNIVWLLSFAVHLSLWPQLNASKPSGPVYSRIIHHTKWMFDEQNRKHLFEIKYSFGAFVSRSEITSNGHSKCRSENLMRRSLNIWMHSTAFE